MQLAVFAHILICGHRRENSSNSKLKPGLMSSDLLYIKPLPRHIFFPVHSFLIYIQWTLLKGHITPEGVHIHRFVFFLAFLKRY